MNVFFSSLPTTLMSTGYREIVNLQIGPFANFVGTHFWNAQPIPTTDADEESVHPDVLFRTGETLEVSYLNMCIY
jgi:hypothetical protein